MNDDWTCFELNLQINTSKKGKITADNALSNKNEF